MAGVHGEVDDGACHDLRSLLSGDDGRDFLVRKNGDQVKVSELDGKIVCLYFSYHWSGTGQDFSPELVAAYKELSRRGGGGRGFEVVLVSTDRHVGQFRLQFSKMPWLAVPFADAAARRRLRALFVGEGRRLPCLVALDGGTGRVFCDDAVEAVSEYGADAFPFTPERLAELEEAAAAAQREQTLRGVLATASRDYVLDGDGGKVPVSELEGKTVVLYFSDGSLRVCVEFTPKLVQMYRELKQRGEGFEVVLVPLDDHKESFGEQFRGMPWLTVPFGGNDAEGIARYFKIGYVPTLVVLGPDGMTLKGKDDDAVELVEDHGAGAYPFSSEKSAELTEVEKAAVEAQTLESLLVSGELDYVIGKDGAKIPVSELVGKNILLYFSARWAPPCRAFTSELIKAYHEIKARDSNFEVVFVSSDLVQSSFDSFYSTMPWLALPLGDERRKVLSHKLKVCSIPSLVVIGPSGRTVTGKGKMMVKRHGSAAYPFTEERMRELELQVDEMASGWPEKLRHELHGEHELVRTRRRCFRCDGCRELGFSWSFYCKQCDFDLHPKCALEAEAGEPA